jgi:hypothetical protein
MDHSTILFQLVGKVNVELLILIVATVELNTMLLHTPAWVTMEQQDRDEYYFSTERILRSKVCIIH